MRPELMVDCGAFSLFKGRHGKPIDLPDFIEFNKRNEEYIDLIVSVDMIAGADGDRTATPEQVERAAAASYRNHQVMREAGVRSLPTFHQGEDFRWLERYLADGNDYICLSPIKHYEVAALAWLAQVFDLIKGSNGQPRIKTHGLGVTASLQCLEFPFTSVDSTTWLQSKNGHILVPVYGADGRPDYTLGPMRVFVTDRSKRRERHFDMLDEYEQDWTTRFLQEEVGVDLQQACDSYRARWRVTISYFRGLEAAAQTRLFFVSSGEASMRDALLESGARSHLLSYFKLRNRHGDTLRRYVDGSSNGH
jgi:hypothetical protein